MQSEKAADSLVRRLASSVFVPPLGITFRVFTRARRRALLKIPGVLSLYRSLTTLLLPPSAGDEVAVANVHGLTIYLDAKDGVTNLGDFAWGQYEVVTSFIFSLALKEGDVAVDVGAHWGYFTLLAAKYCGPSGKVLAFEPHPRNYALLTRSVAANQLTNVVPLQKAVSDRCGTGLLQEGSWSSFHSLCPMPSQWRRGPEGGGGPIRIETTTLDHLFHSSSVRPRLIKLDIEGAEPLALAGARSLITASPDLAIVLEFNPGYLGPAAARDLLETLASWGFRVSIIDDVQRRIEAGSPEQILRRLLELKDYVNLLCMRESDPLAALFGPQLAARRQARQFKFVLLGER